jgi:guanosine-3',5'-bis(diphosphate) 3'-pyrophosphohydrolase
MNTRLWQEAASFAARAHRGQTRRDKVTPYTAHPFRVAMTIRDLFGCDDDICLAGALLHDTIEDTPADYDDIEDAFGREVADVVAAMTKDMRLREPEREPAYDDQLARAGWRAHLVKLADTYDNLTDAISSGKRGLKKMRDRCQRAIDIAEPSRENPHVARGIECVRALLDEHERARAAGRTSAE